MEKEGGVSREVQGLLCLEVAGRLLSTAAAELKICCACCGSRSMHFKTKPTCSCFVMPPVHPFMRRMLLQIESHAYYYI